MEDKTVIIMIEIPPQQGQPFKWGIMMDGKSTTLISWAKQTLETGKTYSITLLDEDAKDVQYDQRRMKKDGKVELLGTEVQGTLEAEIEEPLVEKPGTFIKGDVKAPKPETPTPTPELPTEEPKAMPTTISTEDFEDEFMDMIEDEEKEKANDKLAISNIQKSQRIPNSNKLQLNLESIMILNPIATKQNAMKFLQKCIWQNLNPFVGDCYLITYQNSLTGEQDMSMVVSKDVFLKRSANNANYEGFEAGIIVRVDKKLEHREGSVYIKGEEELIGGWARVYINGLRPIYAQVLVAEYHTGKSLWNTKPATMIRKVAQSQAMREAFPVELQGFYDGAEIEAEEGNNE